MTRDQQFDALSDLFAYGGRSVSELIRCGRCVIIRTQSEQDPAVLEAMFHALHTLTVSCDIAPFLDLSPIIRNWQRFDRECMDYFCEILSLTGNLKYLPLIAEIRRKYPDIDEYELERTELEYRSYHMKKGILFDLDGTLWDSAEQVIEAWNETIRREGRKEQFTVADMHNFMGRTIEVIAAMMFPDEPQEEQLRLLYRCTENEHAYLADHYGRLFEGEEAVMRTLAKDYVLGIVSNCQDGYIERYLNPKENAFTDVFSDLECAGRTGLSKGQNIRLVMERQGITDCIYVGDTQGDADAAKEAGIPFIHAAYGFGKVDACAASLHDIRELPETAAKLFAGLE